MTAFGVRQLDLDVPALAGAFGRRLHEAGVPVTAERSARFAHALGLVKPVSRRRLYWTARAVFVSDPTQARAFDAVFAEVFGRGRDPLPEIPPELFQTAPATDDRPAGIDTNTTAGAPPTGDSNRVSGPHGQNLLGSETEVPVPALASDEERLGSKRFDALEPEELVALYRLMARLRIATPPRRMRRARRDRHGERIDMRRTLRGAIRTGGDPIRLRRLRRRVIRRRMVLLCDISGSMEPYARAYLQFLTCAAANGPGRSEAFAFATRLTRLTRALQSRNPERAIQRAAAAAPDWSSGTRIGDALKTFNDRHGRRGMARGAVIVILSDGWERGDPTLVGREMARLRRLAYRIVWVNPRAAASGFEPRAGGMMAALPHLDSLVSGHSLHALGEVVDAIAAERADDRLLSGPGAPNKSGGSEPEEPWASATPVPGSSVAMPSGYGPSRGKTTPGWGTR